MKKNKNLKKIILTLSTVLSLSLTGCSSDNNKEEETNDSSILDIFRDDEETSTPEASLIPTASPEASDTNPSDMLVQPVLSSPAVNFSEIPAYSGQMYIPVNDGKPYFTDQDLKAGEASFEMYSDLDSLGRCGTAFASINMELMPTEDRESISEVTPSGWNNKEYDSVDGGWLYNRCHLIGFQLAGENANPCNLITGTRSFNVDGMLPFENITADYIKETNNHVLYRVTPYYEGNNLVASGVLMEGRSIEDEGDGIEFCSYVYNVQPGITINYANGDSQETASASVNTAADAQSVTYDYVLNTNSMKFHYSWCNSVGIMSERNKSYYTGTRESVINMGYEPCKNCNP